MEGDYSWRRWLQLEGVVTAGGRGYSWRGWLQLEGVITDGGSGYSWRGWLLLEGVITAGGGWLQLEGVVTAGGAVPNIFECTKSEPDDHGCILLPWLQSSGCIDSRKLSPTAHIAAMLTLIL